MLATLSVQLVAIDIQRADPTEKLFTHNATLSYLAKVTGDKAVTAFTGATYFYDSTGTLRLTLGLSHHESLPQGKETRFADVPVWLNTEKTASSRWLVETPLTAMRVEFQPGIITLSDGTRLRWRGGAVDPIDGNCPASYDLKGIDRAGSKTYLVPGDAGYAAAIAVKCFETAADAASAGYARAK